MQLKPCEPRALLVRVSTFVTCAIAWRPRSDSACPLDHEADAESHAVDPVEAGTHVAVGVRGSARIALLLAALLVAGPAFPQTPVSPPRNKYTPEQDVELGRKAAQEVRQQYPVISDRGITEYLDGLGRQLVAVAPPELNKSVFQYSFTPVNLKEINAFALPGGPMFVNRGMFDAATAEAEVVGVMAHEMSHVLLRHGTANMTKAQGFCE
jgi:hypothetical protein